MNEHAKRIQKPRCFLLYGLAPSGLPAAEANRILSTFIGDPALPLAIFHDHVIGQPGGVVLFYVETTQERDVLLTQKYLEGWHVEIQPLIFSHSGINWETLQKEKRPSYGNPSREAETAQEEE